MAPFMQLQLVQQRCQFSRRVRRDSGEQDIGHEVLFAIQQRVWGIGGDFGAVACVGGFTAEKWT